MSESHLPSSFRDIGGFVYESEGIIYRKIFEDSYEDYTKLITSGLYDYLVESKYLVSHDEILNSSAVKNPKSIILRPEQIRFITYPYEWCFSQLKDAALLTLQICIDAIEYGMILKDATAYNIQFHNGKPILIDTCSLSKYKEGEAWVAYQQFCKHFLAPLLLMSKTDIRLNLLSKIHIDGVPLDLTSRLLPIKSWASPSILAHIHMHARAQNKYAGSGDSSKNKIRNISKIGMLGLLNSLKRSINKLKVSLIDTEWGDYYNFTNYSNSSASHKADTVLSMVKQSRASTVLDIGSNNGQYSRVATAFGATVLSADIDPIAVEHNYLTVKNKKESNIIPIIQDMTNPSSSIGWAHNERGSLQDRGAFDLVMALALVHHLAISNNVPFDMIAKYFSKLGKFLIIEFVPKEDSQVVKLLSSRRDIFINYNKNSFEKAFGEYYTIIDEIMISESKRTMYLMQVK